MTTSKADCILPINGIILLDKSQGMSSNAALQKVKRLFRAKKAGHTGSLDPLATGMLPICFGEATKLCQYLLDAEKCYEATGMLGMQTSTGDSLGESTHTASKINVTQEQLHSVMQQFIGRTLQTPSMYSALKHQGTPLYKLARAGITIERKPREIVVDTLELLAFDGMQFKISVSCSKGTYIRNLIEDIGIALGVYAHMTQLHRVYTAGFDKEAMYTLDELVLMDETERLNCLLPMERAIPNMPDVIIEPEELQSLRQGKTLTFTGRCDLIGTVSLRDKANQFAGLGEIDNNRILKVKRLLAF